MHFLQHDKHSKEPSDMVDYIQNFLNNSIIIFALIYLGNVKLFACHTSSVDEQVPIKHILKHLVLLFPEVFDGQLQFSR